MPIGPALPLRYEFRFSAACNASVRVVTKNVDLTGSKRIRCGVDSYPGGRLIRLITRLKGIPQGPSLMATIEETMKQLISSGSTFERDIAYSRAVVDGEWVFVS